MNTDVSVNELERRLIKLELLAYNPEYYQFSENGITGYVQNLQNRYDKIELECDALKTLWDKYKRVETLIEEGSDEFDDALISFMNIINNYKKNKKGKPKNKNELEPDYDEMQEEWLGKFYNATLKSIKALEEEIAKNSTVFLDQAKQLKLLHSLINILNEPLPSLDVPISPQSLQIKYEKKIDAIENLRSDINSFVKNYSSTIDSVSNSLLTWDNQLCHFEKKLDELIFMKKNPGKKYPGKEKESIAGKQKKNKKKVKKNIKLVQTKSESNKITFYPPTPSRFILPKPPDRVVELKYVAITGGTRVDSSLPITPLHSSNPTTLNPYVEKLSLHTLSEETIEECDEETTPRL